MLVIAKGYPNQYGGIQNELRASLAKPSKWYPTVDDFRATAKLSGGSSGEVATFDELLDFIARQPERSLTDLSLIGHGSPDGFGLGGRLQSDGLLHFSDAGLIYPWSLNDKRDKIKSVRNRFNTQTAVAAITLYACDAGLGMKLLDSISGAFQVKVRGFTQQIWWCFTVTAGKVNRGRTFLDVTGLYGPDDHPDCDSLQFLNDIRKWVPDQQSYKGLLIDL